MTAISSRERRVGTGSSFTFVKMSSRVKEIHISD
jgi:hypothetical protein